MTSSVGTNFHLKQTVFVFWTKATKKNIFLVQSRTNDHHHHQIQHIWIGLSTKFHLKKTILFFWTKFAPKGYLQSKTEKVNITMEFSIFELVKMPSFILKRKFWYFWSKSVAKVLFIINNSSIPKVFSFHKICLLKGKYFLRSLLICFSH